MRYIFITLVNKLALECLVCFKKTLNFHFNHILVKPNILYLLSYQPTYYCMLIYKLITSTILKFEITFFLAYQN